MMTVPDALRSWFDVHGCAGLILPDGWYGRPFDNQHYLTSVEYCSETLNISLDEDNEDNVVLTFQGSINIQENGVDLVLSGFKNLVVKTKHSTVDYLTGDVRFKACD